MKVHLPYIYPPTWRPARLFGSCYFPSNSADMPVPQEDWISNPLGVVRELFEHSGSGRGSWEVQEFFAAKLDKEEDLVKIPFLNATPLEQLPSGCLVRYRGMVQDQFDPELYLRVYHSTNTSTGDTAVCCGMYRDILDNPPGHEVDLNHDGNVTADRQMLYCVPIPGETEWAKATYSSATLQQAVEMEQESGGRQGKRRLSENEDDGEMEVEGVGHEDTPISKRQKEDQPQPSSASAGIPSSESPPNLNFPLPDEKGVPCMVKVYGGDTDSLRVTATVEFIGVLTVDPTLVHFDQGEVIQDPFLAETAAERKARYPPPSLIPRLHCIIAKRLCHSHPLLPSNLTQPIATQVFSGLCGDALSSRALLLDILTHTLLGDQLAAEYTLFHLLSSVYGRTEVLALGKFSLNLTNCCRSHSQTEPHSQSQPQVKESLATSFYSVLQKLVPKCFLLSMSLSNMNSWKFTPKKDYSANRLLAGVLQLTDGTPLAVDETALSPGQLNEVGVANLTALGNMLQWQKVNYDFQFHTAEFECDLPVVIFSEGKSILTVDCQVPLSFSSSAAPQAGASLVSQLSEEQLRQARLYLGLHRALEYQLPGDVQKHLEEDFVEMRRADPEMNAEVFHYLLSVARLVSLSYGCSELSLDHWQRTKELEQQRKDRIKAAA